MLASADFSRELTTSVLWLRERDLDIRCVRLLPYQLGSEIVVDIQQVIPLPEAAQYQIQLRLKARQEEARGESNRDFTRYDLRIGSHEELRLFKRQLIFRVVQHALRGGATPDDITKAVNLTHDHLWREATGILSPHDFIAGVNAVLGPDGRVFAPNRFFCAEDELFQINGKTYSFTNQWGGQEVLDAVDALITKFGNVEISYQPSTEVII